MKTKYIIILIIGIIVLVLLFVLLTVLLLIPKIKDKKIENITHLRFTYTTGYHMNASVSYEIDLKDNKYIATIKPTDIPEEETKEYEISKDKVKEIENKLNEYKVSRWNNFRKSDKYVLDGDSFSMNINSNDLDISASGYMMWPNNYREVKSYLDTTLGSLYKEE